MAGDGEREEEREREKEKAKATKQTERKRERERANKREKYTHTHTHTHTHACTHTLTQSRDKQRRGERERTETDRSCPSLFSSFPSLSLSLHRQICLFSSLRMRFRSVSHQSLSIRLIEGESGTRESETANNESLDGLFLFSPSFICLTMSAYTIDERREEERGRERHRKREKAQKVEPKVVRERTTKNHIQVVCALSRFCDRQSDCLLNDGRKKKAKEMEEKRERERERKREREDCAQQQQVLLVLDSPLPFSLYIYNVPLNSASVRLRGFAFPSRTALEFVVERRE